MSGAVYPLDREEALACLAELTSEESSIEHPGWPMKRGSGWKGLLVAPSNTKFANSAIPFPKKGWEWRDEECMLCDYSLSKAPMLSFIQAIS